MRLLDCDPRSSRSRRHAHQSHPMCPWPRVVIRLFPMSGDCALSERGALSSALPVPSLCLTGREQSRRVAGHRFADLAIRIELKALRCPPFSSVVIMQGKSLNTHQHLAKGESQGGVLAQASLNIGSECCAITDCAVGPGYSLQDQRRAIVQRFCVG